MRQVKIIVEKHADGYVAYPHGLKGVVVAKAAATRKPSQMSIRHPVSHRDIWRQG